MNTYNSEFAFFLAKHINRELAGETVGGSGWPQILEETIYAFLESRRDTIDTSA